MKITDVSVTLFAWENLPAFRYANNTATPTDTSQLGLVTITTDEGLEGHAFLGSSYLPANFEAPLLIHHLKPLLIGANPLDRERLYHALWNRSRAAPIRAIGALDVALWDLAGKIAGMPVHQLLGSYRTSVPAYASSQKHETVEAYCEQAMYYKENGWAAYKIHPPQRWREDIEICEAVRDTVGDDYTLMLDSIWGYDFTEAMRVGRAIEDLEYYWYEDPLKDQDIYNYVKLREKLDIPIMATEYPLAGFDSFAPWIMQKATDYLRGDVAVKGGITTLIKAAHLAEAFALNFEVHHGGNSLNNVANLHVIMAIKNCEFFEVLLPDEGHKYGLAEEITVGKDGLVHAPMKPGLGAEIDFDLIKAKTVAVLR